MADVRVSEADNVADDSSVERPMLVDLKLEAFGLYVNDPGDGVPYKDSTSRGSTYKEPLGCSKATRTLHASVYLEHLTRQDCAI